MDSQGLGGLLRRTCAALHALEPNHAVGLDPTQAVCEAHIGEGV